jgi:uncharacterized protein YecT (DUF1311 family)
VLDERSAWQAARNADSRQAYERYLMAFPSGLYALAARDRITALSRQELAALQRPPEAPPPAPAYRTPEVEVRPPPPSVSEVSSPSFNCLENTGIAEQAVCASPQLARLDVELSKLFFLLRGRLDAANGVRLRDSQRLWLKRRDACMNDWNCLEAQYVSRIRELRNWGG